MSRGPRKKCKATGKKRYWSYKDAEAALDELAQLAQPSGPPPPRFVYRCHRCRSWHVTRMPQWSKMQKRRHGRGKSRRR